MVEMDYKMFAIHGDLTAMILGDPNKATHVYASHMGIKQFLYFYHHIPSPNSTSHFAKFIFIYLYFLSRYIIQLYQAYGMIIYGVHSKNVEKIYGVD